MLLSILWHHGVGSRDLLSVSRAYAFYIVGCIQLFVDIFFVCAMCVWGWARVLEDNAEGPNPSQGRWAGKLELPWPAANASTIPPRAQVTFNDEGWGVVSHLSYLQWPSFELPSNSFTLQ